MKRAGVLALLVLVACSDSASSPPASSGDGGSNAFDNGEELRVPVGPGRTYVALRSPPAIVTPANPETDRSWDLAFEGLDVYTNGGASGRGRSAGFGPLEPIVFLENVAPDVPFLTTDKTGGAFLRWYLYEGAPNHALYSRFHVFGVKDGERLFRVQILSYYGQRDGAPVSALYKIRYAEVGQPAKEAADLDGTAGGVSGEPDAPSECIDLGTGARAMLRPAEASASTAWHLCFRRESIAVNGEAGGPRNVGAVDFEAEQVATEKLADVAPRTAESELAKFDAITAASFQGQTLRGDRIVSAFSGLWTERNASPAAPRSAAWLVLGADGQSQYLTGFARFEGASATAPGTVVMRVKAVQ